MPRVRRRASKHIDETTWRTIGDNEYLWSFVSKWEATFVVAQRRAHDVPLDVLGEDPSGTITTIGHRAYHTLVHKAHLVHQRC